MKVSFATYDELRGAIGREVALSDWVPVTQAQIEQGYKEWKKLLPDGKLPKKK